MQRPLDSLSAPENPRTARRALEDPWMVRFKYYVHSIYMMGTITVVISDELEREIRKLISKEGKAKKGALSRLVENALWAYIRSQKARERVFMAIKDGKVVAEARSLYDLADKLREAGIDPRSVRIVSSPPPRPRRRLGLRCGRV